MTTTYRSKMSLRSINDIENDVENEILESYRERFVENDEEYTLLIEAPNGVVCDMACGLLEDNDIKYVKKALRRVYASPGTKRGCFLERR